MQNLQVFQFLQPCDFIPQSVRDFSQIFQKFQNVFFGCFQSTFKFFLSQHFFKNHITLSHLTVCLDVANSLLELFHQSILKIPFALFQISRHKLQKPDKLRRHFFLIFPFGTQKNRITPVIQLHLFILLTLTSKGIAVQPLSKGIEIADKDYKCIRQGLILFSACQCFHHHLAVVVPASFSQGFLLSHLHFHVVMGMVLILRIDVQADTFVFGMVDQAPSPEIPYSFSPHS